jgi:hypothetical protein
MTLKDELKKLGEYMDSSNELDAKKQIDFIRANFSSEKDENEINSFISSRLKDLTERVDDVISTVEVKLQLMEVSKIVSLSYIAQNYFNKTRQWLYQKINGNMVNGKKASFTPDEIQTLNFALQDVSKKIGSIAIVK